MTCRSCRTVGTLLGAGIFALVLISRDFRLLGGGATYLCDAAFLGVLLFSPVKAAARTQGGLTVGQLYLVKALAIEFAILGMLALVCHGATFRFENILSFVVTIVSVTILYVLMARTSVESRRTISMKGYFRRALSPKLVFLIVAYLVGLLYLLFFLKAIESRVDSVEIAKVGMAIITVFTLITTRLTFDSSAIKSVQKEVLAGAAVFLGITAILVVLTELITSNGWYFMCSSLIIASGLTSSAMSIWPLQENEQRVTP